MTDPNFGDLLLTNVATVLPFRKVTTPPKPAPRDPAPVRPAAKASPFTKLDADIAAIRSQIETLTKRFATR